MFLGFAYFKRVEFRLILLLSFVSFGFCYLPMGGGDSLNHTYYFLDTVNKPLSELWSIIKDVLTFHYALETDLYKSIANFLISRFTDSPSFLFGFHALVFGVFYLGSLKILIEYKYKNNINSIIFAVFFLSLIFVHRIGYVRFYIATWFFFFYTYYYMLSGRYRYLVSASFAVLIHFSFLPLTLLLWLLHVTGIHLRLFFVLFVLSLFAPLTPLSMSYFFPASSSQQNSIVEQRVASYSDVDYIEIRQKREASKAWYAKYKLPLLEYFYLISLLIVGGYLHKTSNIDTLQKRILAFSLLGATLFNFINEWFGASERYLLVMLLFPIAYLYRYFLLNPKTKLHLLSYLAITPMSLWIVMEIRSIVESTSVLFLFGSPLYTFFFDMDISIWDIIK